MGDFGPAYYAQQQQQQGSARWRCEECGLELPVSSGAMPCSMCGGALRRVGAAPAPPTATASGNRTVVGDVGGLRDDEAMNLAAEVLQQIIPSDLLDGLTEAPRPADEEALEELPLVRITPHVLLSVAVGPAGPRAGSAAPSREVLAAAAERRLAAGSGSEAAEPTHSAVGEVGEVGEEEAAPELLPAGFPREMRGTSSSFGTLMSDLGDAGVRAPLVLAAPLDGSAPLLNAEEAKGALVVLWRGGCSFVDKVRRAQLAGAAAALVVQEAGKKYGGGRLVGLPASARLSGSAKWLGEVP